MIALERRLASIESKLPEWNARLKTLEKHHPLEVRLRLLEARVSQRSQRPERTAACAGDRTMAFVTACCACVVTVLAMVWQIICSAACLNLPPRTESDPHDQPSHPSSGLSFPEEPPHKDANEDADTHVLDGSVPESGFCLKAGLDGYSESLALVDVEDCGVGEGCGGGGLSERAKIGLLHREALRRGLDTYIDPATGYDVFTAHHLKTRECCGSSCRHCPWGHRNVPGKRSDRATEADTAAVDTAAVDTAAVDTVSALSVPEAPPPPRAGEGPPPGGMPADDPPPPKSRLYTRKGDSGWGCLYSEQSILKSHPIYDAIGDVDELNSCVGLACQLLAPPSAGLLSHAQLAAHLASVQAWLLDVGSALCTPRTSTLNARKLQRTRGVSAENVITLEGWIDVADDQLTRLQSFILPGGSRGAAALHCARAVCRRAERRVWPLLQEGHADDVIGVFLNRLSDFLFVAARLDAHSAGAAEQQYKIEWRIDRWQRQLVKAV